MSDFRAITFRAGFAFRTGCMALLTAGFLLQTEASQSEIRFNRDIRSILAEHCWQCHGPDAAARQSSLRLDLREAAVAAADSGRIAIVPGRPDESELVRRITTEDVSLRMPPAEHGGMSLNESQVATLQQWIQDGAHWETHWAFQIPIRPTVPKVEGVSHPIDAFVLARLHSFGRKLAPRASRDVLLRRAAFDLTGLPPAVDDSERDDERWDETIRRLLASPHFGERMAVDWMDAARYADTNGYFSDKPRQMWLWRDWVIDAFNDNMPFDQFTIEQLAGDLLAAPTVRQRIATGFNRNHPANNETGIIDEEYRVEYVADRVDTTMTTWLGMTIACARCHDHKYDPVTQKEFYQLFDFFNQVPETGLIVTDNPPPLISVTTPEQDAELSRLAQRRRLADEAWAGHQPDVIARIRAQEPQLLRSLTGIPGENSLMQESFSGNLSDGTQPVGTTIVFQKGIRGECADFDGTKHGERRIDNWNPDAAWTIGVWIYPEGTPGCIVSKITSASSGTRQPGTGLAVMNEQNRITVILAGQKPNSEPDFGNGQTRSDSTVPTDSSRSAGPGIMKVTTRIPFAKSQWHHVVVTSDGSRKASGIQILIDGVPVPLEVESDQFEGTARNEEPLRIGRYSDGVGYYGLMDELTILEGARSHEEISDWTRSEQLTGILERPPEARSVGDQAVLEKDFIRSTADEPVRNAWHQMQEAQAAEKRFRESIPTTLVMEDKPERRVTQVLNRGQYDQPGETVEPAVPEVLGRLPENAPRNRLGLAQWLVSSQNPLTSRVIVNRLWKQCFGEGLVRSMNDFGTQGEYPTHPELLDWLAVTFQESGWDVKAMLQLIMTSETWMQDSSINPSFLVTGRTADDVQGGRFDSSNHVADQPSDFDPENRLLARGPSFRLSAEMVRDQALVVSGLLRTTIGGPSVRPFQPPGLWEEVSYNGEDTYVPDVGDGLWRRSLYTILKRQAPSPSYMAFDGTTREQCLIQRSVTNTPLQALVLLNDPTWTAASATLAEQAVRSNLTDQDRIRWVWMRIPGRTIRSEEEQIMLKLLERQRARFENDPRQTEQLLEAALGETSPAAVPNQESQQISGGNPDTQGAPADVQRMQAEIAAWTIVIHTIFNLDECITRR